MMQIIDEDGYSDGEEIEDDTLVGHNVRKFNSFVFIPVFIAAWNENNAERPDHGIPKEDLETFDVILKMNLFYKN